MLPESKTMTVWEHLEELRRCLLISLGLSLLFASVAYFKLEQLIGFLTKPLGSHQLHFFRPLEGLLVKAEIIIATGLAAAGPFIVWQMLTFILPGLYHKEKSALIRFMLPGVPAFYLGVFLSFKYTFPYVLDFIISTGTGTLLPMLSGLKYFSFLVTLCLAGGLLAEMPVVLITLASLGIIRATDLKKFRLKAYICILLVVGLLVPTPDLFTLLGIASPGLFLYEATVLIIIAMEKFRKTAVKHVSI